MNPIATFATTAALLASCLPAQMGKRWIDQYSGTIYAQSQPRVGTAAPDLRLWDLDGRPRSLHLERGRKLVLIAGSYT
jgi:hypothetical protein